MTDAELIDIDKTTRRTPRYGEAIIGKVLFSLAGIDRIHILGCSRSGTTMLHLAMVCFKNVVISECESDIWYPYLPQRAELVARMGWRPSRKHYITKRHFGWFMPHRVEDLIEQTRLENIGLIHLVRDPRDVMLSKHLSDNRGSSQPYVSAEHWYRSILAADRIFEALKTHTRKIALRYEDIVRDPGHTEQRISAAFGLQRNARAFPINRVKDNVECMGIHLDSFSATPALNGLRNMDDRSIGRWRDSGAPSIETMEPTMRSRYKNFCEEHGYEL
jgi:Sulfotransferase family